MFDIYSQPLVPPRRRRSVSSSNSSKSNTNKENNQLRYYLPSHHVSTDFLPKITPIESVRNKQQVIDPRVRQLDQTQYYYNANPIRTPIQPSIVEQKYQNQKPINKSETNLYSHQTYRVTQPFNMNVNERHERREQRSRSPSPNTHELFTGIRGRNLTPQRIQLQPNDPYFSNKQNYSSTLEPMRRSASPSHRMRFSEEPIPPPRPPPPKNYVQDAYYNITEIDYNPIDIDHRLTSDAQKSLIPIPITPKTESQPLLHRRSASPMPSQTYGMKRDPSPIPNASINNQRASSPFPSFNNIPVSQQILMQQHLNIRKERSSSPEFMSFKNLMQDREIDESKPVSSEFYKQNVTQHKLNTIHSPLKSLFSKNQTKSHKTKPNDTKQKKNASIKTSFLLNEDNLYPEYNQQNVIQSAKSYPKMLSQSVPLNTTQTETYDINDNDYEPKRFLSPFPSIKDSYDSKPTKQETYADHYDQYKSVTSRVVNNNRLSRDFDSLSTDSDLTERKSSTLPKKNNNESKSREDISLVTSNIDNKTPVGHHISVTPTRKISAGQRKASLPEDYIAQNISEVWTREKVASLSHEARVKTQDKLHNINFDNRKYLDWCSRQLFLILVMVINILLAIVFYYLINMLPNET